MSRTALPLALIAGALAVIAAILWSVDGTDADVAFPGATPGDVRAPAGAQPVEPAGAAEASSDTDPRAARIAERAEVPLPGGGAAAGEEGGATLELATIRVLVRSEDTGAPLPDALVSGWVREPARLSTHTSASATTDASGWAELRVLARAYATVSVSEAVRMHGSARSSVPPLDPGETFELVLEVPTAAETPFRGRVVAAESGAPIAGARVAIRQTILWTAGSAAEYAGQVLRSVVTDSGGNFTVGFPTWNARVHALVEAPGRTRRIVKVERAGRNAAPVEIRMTPDAVLLVATTSSGGLPLAGVGVRLVAPRGSVRQDVITGDLAWSGETDASGALRLDGLVPDTRLLLDLRPPGGELRRRPEAFTLAPGEVREVTLQVGTGATIHGRVVGGDGIRVGYAKVSLAPAEVAASALFASSSRREPVIQWSDGRGGFRFDDVADGDWTVGFAEGRYAPWREEVRVRGGVADREVVLTAHRDLHVSGRVVGPDGAIVREARVLATSLDGRSRASARANTEGQFEIGPLAPGAVRLTADSGHLAPSDEVLAKAGDDDVVLKLRRGGSIRGQLRDAAGAPVEAGVVAYEPERGGSGATAARSDGTFELGGLAPGAYALVARTSGGDFGLLPSAFVAEGTVREVVITLTEGARLRLRNASQHDVSFAVRAAGIPVASGHVSGGESALEDVPSGDVTVRFGDGEVRSLRLLPGEEHETVYGESDP